MLNQMFWKKVQGKNYPGRWEIAERKIPSVKMLFNTNTNGHKHLSIGLIMPRTPPLGRQCGFSFLEASSPVQKTPLSYQKSI